LIRISIDLDEHGCLKHIAVLGHAEYVIGGQNIVCSAVTALVRTVAHAFTKYDDFKATVKAVQPGDLELWISAHPPKRLEWVKGVTEVLLTGIFDLEAEYPDSIEINR
jgi:uncharacterized protein YsxB (DUF464 family)